MLPVSTGSQNLTEMQAKFVALYSSDPSDKTKAAILAGYSEHTADTQASELLRKPHVLAAILEATAMELISNAPRAKNNLVRLMNSKSEYVSLQATQDLLDRAGLKPTERVDHRVSGSVSVSIDLS